MRNLTNAAGGRKSETMAQLKLAKQDKKDLINRLKRAEGQMRGVQRMVEQERDCGAILQQMTAVRSALHTASLELARTYATQCLVESDDAETTAEAVNMLIKALGKLP